MSENKKHFFGIGKNKAEASPENAPEQIPVSDEELDSLLSDISSESNGAEANKIDDSIFEQLLESVKDIDQDNGEATAETEDGTEDEPAYGELADKVEEEPTEAEDAEEEPAETEAEDTEETSGEDENAPEAEGEVEPEEGVNDEFLLSAFGYAGAKGAEVEAVKVEKKKPEKKPRSELTGAFAYDGEEYTDRSQAEGIRARYSTERFWMYLRLVMTALMTATLFCFDTFGSSMTGPLSMTEYPTVHILVSLQILLVAAAFSWKRMIEGIDLVVSFAPNIHSIPSVTLILVVIYDVILAIAAPESFTLYNFPAALCILLSVIYDHLKLSAEIRNFGKLTSYKKYAMLKKTDSEEIADGLNDSTENLSENEMTPETVGRAFVFSTGDFAENYFKRTNKKDTTLGILNYIITPVIAAALIVFIASMASSRSLTDSLNAFICTVLFAMPAFAAAIYCYPFFRLGKARLGKSTLVLNETDISAYSEVDTVIVDESELFGEDTVVLSDIRLCGDEEIGDILYGGVTAVTSMLTHLNCGFLSNALGNATVSGVAGDAIITRSERDGFEGIVDGRVYLVGNESFMRENLVDMLFDRNMGIEKRKKSGVSTVYVAVDGNLALKLYVAYRLSDNGIRIMEKLNKCGLSAVINTSDFNLTDEFISGIISAMKTPVRVLRNAPTLKDDETVGEAADETSIDGSLIAESTSFANLVKATSDCTNYRRIQKLNLIIGAVMLFSGALLGVLLGILGVSIGMMSLYIALFQLVTVLPTVIITRLLIG